MTNERRQGEEADERYQIMLANEQATYAIDERQIVSAARAVLSDSQFSSADISIAVVDDETIHQLNRQYLAHDYPTDVLSFVLEERGGHLEGEVIISAETAAATAHEVGWSASAEQLLYVVHGVLHLVGFRDKISADAAQMRAAERRYLKQFGYELPGKLE